MSDSPRTVLRNVCVLCGSAVLRGEHLDVREPCFGETSLAAEAAVAAGLSQFHDRMILGDPDAVQSAIIAGIGHYMGHSREEDR